MDSLCIDYGKNTPETIKNRIATMSCKAAVKGNNRLNIKEMENLWMNLWNLKIHITVLTADLHLSPSVNMNWKRSLKE